MGSEMCIRDSTGMPRYKFDEFVTRHARETDSAIAKRLLNNWTSEVNNFWHIVPTEILSVLSHPIAEAELSSQTA